MTGAPQRVRYRPGQWLGPGDLNEAVRTAELLGAWHNRAVHDPFGVCEGLAVTPRDGGVVVGAGVANDVTGAPVRLPGERPVAWPDRDGTFDLRLRPGPAGAARLGWTPVGRWDPRDGVPLARVVVLGGVPGDLVAGTVRSRPSARPRTAAGATHAGATAWEPWWPGGTRAGGVTVRVDTTAAGFVELDPGPDGAARPPTYLAGLETEPGPSLAVLAVWVEEPAATGFRVRVLAVVPGAGDAAADRDEVLAAASRDRLRVRWLGVQGGAR